MNQEAKILVGIGIATIIILVGAIFLLSKSSPAQNVSSASVDTKLLIRDDSHKISSNSANLKVTIVEFGDYQCPACGQAYPITKQVLKDYSGRINFVFRNFPLPQHQNALISAEAAEAAGAQGKFWQMHDKLYETQNDWADSNQPLNIFTGFAKNLGLDVLRFQNDVSTNKYADRITQDQSDGNTLGINATPTFFINGQKIEGVMVYEDFKGKIDPLLSK